MKIPKIKPLEHTADYMVRIEADNLSELFYGGLMSITSYCSDIKSFEKLSSEETLSVNINLHDESLEGLFISFLNEVIFMMETKRAVFYKMNVALINENNVECNLIGVPGNVAEKEAEIKAATYHNLNIEYKNGKFFATVLFDV